MLRSIKIILLAFLILFSSGCENSLSPEPAKPRIDPNLPTVEGIKTLNDITAIAFEWQPNYGAGIEGYYLYRSNPSSKDSKLKRVAIIKNKFTSHYVDKGLTPNTLYHYKMATFSSEGRESNPSQTVSVKTMPLLESVPFIRAIVGLPNMVKLIWRPHPDKKVVKYIIERKGINETQWKEIAVIEGRLNAEYIDKGLKNNTVYQYRVKVETFDKLVSSPSKVVQAKTKPLPKVVENLKASTNLPRKIELTWSANPEPDIVYYNVYRSLAPRLFYSYLAKTNDTSFIDIVDEDGVARYYKVTAVDKDGLESQKQSAPIQGITLDKPATPTIVSAGIVDGEVHIKWISTDDRAVKFNVLKSYGMANKQKYTNISGLSFVDMEVKPGVEYIYEVSAVDKYGIESKPSIEIKLKLPEKND